MLPNQAAAMQAMSQCTGAPRTWRCTKCGMSKWLPRKNLLSWSKLLLYFYLSECLHLSILHYLCANCFALWEMFKQTTLVTPVASQDQLRSAPFCMGRCVVWTAMNCTTWPSGFAAWLKINGKPWAKRYDSYGGMVCNHHKPQEHGIFHHTISFIWKPISNVLKG